MKLNELIHSYKKGENIIELLDKNCPTLTREEKIIISYDLQSGSYTDHLTDNPEYYALKEQIGIKSSRILSSLNIQSCCEAGVGEGTTLKFILKQDTMRNIVASAFDISVSRLLYCKKNLEKRVQKGLFVSQMLDIALPDNSHDCVMTFHAIEPNGGMEFPIVKEIGRVAAKYMFLVEPDFERFGQAQKDRMLKHGYCRNLREAVDAAGFDLIVDEPWELDVNPKNKASLLIARKKEQSVETQQNSGFISPITGNKLEKCKDGWFAPEDGHIFPEISGLPVLLSGKEILVSHYGNT